MPARADTERGAETRLLREIILEHLSRREPKSARDLLDDVRNDFGSCGLRRFWNNLRWLIRARAVVRTGKKQTIRSGYVKAQNAHSITMVAERPTCSICGLVGRTRMSHSKHSQEAKRWPALMEHTA